jgi:hypothetical protein
VNGSKVVQRVANRGDAERRAKQGILFELNGRVHEAAMLFESAQRDRDLWDFTCECGAPDCRASVSLTLADYEALHEAGQPVLVAGHEVRRAAKARQDAQKLRGDAAALKGQAELQQKRAERNTRRT